MTSQQIIIKLVEMRRAGCSAKQAMAYIHTMPDMTEREALQLWQTAKMYN